MITKARYHGSLGGAHGAPLPGHLVLLLAAGWLMSANDAFAQSCPTVPPSTVTLTVNSTADGLNPMACQNQTPGLCTIREAIEEANTLTGVTIAVPAGTYTLTIPPIGPDLNGTGDLNITSAMVLHGAAAKTTIIRAGTTASNGIDRVLHISGSGEVQVSDVTIEYGLTNATSGMSVQGGGGILFDGFGPLCISDSEVIYNSTTNQTYGGGLTDIGSGAVYVTGVAILHNTSANSGGGIEAVQNGDLYINKSFISFNSATGSGTGGGLDSYVPTGTGGVLVVNGSRIENNSASGLWGGGVSIWGNNTTINDAYIDSNSLLPGGLGGGLFVAGTGTLSLRGSHVNSNVNGSPTGHGFNQGGGMHLATSGVVQLTTTDVIGNSVVAGNVGPIIEADGGGIFYAGYSRLVIDGKSSIARNTTSGNSGSRGFGGGVGIAGGTITISGATIQMNTTSGGGGGLEQGGGSLIFQTSSVDSNTAQGDGGGLMIVGTNATISGVNITNNSITNAAGTGCGGGAYFVEQSGGSISLSQISGNKAPGGGGLCLSNSSPMAVSNDTISNNIATAQYGGGGGIAIALTEAVTIGESTIANNTAFQGAGIYGNAAIVNSTIANNQGPGIGIERTGHWPTIAFSTISGNAVGIDPMTEFIGELSLLGTIVANNGLDCKAKVPIVNLGYNLIGSSTCEWLFSEYPPGSGHYSYGYPGTVTNVNPLLGPLQNNGGPTMTMAPTSGSPAINVVPATVCPPPNVDQRGTSRPQGSACDIGAVEVTQQ